MMLKKVTFRLEHDKDGYPPVGVESVWAKEDADGHFMIDNIPFFAQDATLGDVVEATLLGGELRYKSIVQPSKNSLVRIICNKGTDTVEISSRFEKLGCKVELYGAYSLIAISVPPHVDIDEIRAVLQTGFEEEKWDYEEPLLRQ